MRYLIFEGYLAKTLTIYIIKVTVGSFQRNDTLKLIKMRNLF